MLIPTDYEGWILEIMCYTCGPTEKLDMNSGGFLNMISFRSASMPNFRRKGVTMTTKAFTECLKPIRNIFHYVFIIPD